MKIAIIDIIGIPYDGTTVFKQGLGGSESAVTYVSRELVRLGFDVTIFNNCNIDHASPGIYDGVTYRPLMHLSPREEHSFDIVISSRTVIPFTDPQDYVRLNDGRALPFQNYDLYDRILAKAKMRILWMHDTFCLGDNIIEELVVQNRITDIFTLSDFHLTYVANCNHGRRRNFEVLKRKFFITRNGVNIYNREVDIKSKDRDLFVYNASVTKGMIPLVNDIWPEIKRNIPSARLKVIGGYYRFGTNAKPDQQELDWRAMADDPANAELGIEFTGVISQREIADIMAQANFMLYPAAFPETFGISSMESMCYNTPLVTCRFGALEEIAVERANYLIDYAIEPNSLFTDIDKNSQVKKFVQATIKAYSDTYLHQQKQYYCNIIKDIAGWDSVALQWKQHFYHQTGGYLSKDEYRRVSKINHRVHQIWGRRYTNACEIEPYRAGRERKIVVVSTFYNCQDYISCCIDSVISQDYDNYEHILINDASTDMTEEVILEKMSSLPVDIVDKYKYLPNHERYGAVYNQVRAFREIDDPDAIVMILDGDDSLVNKNSIFSFYNEIFSHDVEFAYGSCWSLADNIPLISQPYPEEVKKSRSYRQHHFNWILPYTHLRVFKKKLIDGIPDSAFQDDQGQWYRAGGDGSVFYSLIERARPEAVHVVQDVVYNYNDRNPLNDYKVNNKEQNIAARNIISKRNQQGYTVIVPTMWRANDIFLPFLAELCSHRLIDQIVVINNDRSSTPTGLPDDPKLELLDFGKNIYVNPAWNVGVGKSRNDRICILNDDVRFDLKLLEKLYDLLTTEAGVFGLCPGVADFHQIPVTTKTIDILPWQAGQHTYGFGCLMFIHKDNYSYIPNGLDIYYGDNYVFDLQLSKGRTNYLITNMSFSSPMAATTGDTGITGGFLERERKIYQEIKSKMDEQNDLLKKEYATACQQPTDINQHLPLLHSLASQCDTVVELGVRTGVSTRALLASGCKNLHSFDLYLDDRVTELFDHAKKQGKNCNYQVGDSLTMTIPETDLLFIDTYHTYKQLRSELNRHHSRVSKYIAFHDTFTYGLKTDQDQLKGIFTAIVEFMIDHPEWKFKYHTSENNGFTVIEKNNGSQPNLDTTISSIKKKKILIAIPTAKNIEAETFRSIYNLEIPNGYQADFQYFYGYNIDQVRNLIADWVVKGYDYLFSVDSDIAFAPDTLKKLLSHDRDVVSGLYIQRKPGKHTLEIYEHNERGGVSNMPYGKLKGRELVEIAGCGFGCVLVKGEVMRKIGYPQFKYYSAIDHANTISEDVDFCKKAINAGFKIWAAPRVQCRHIGSTEFLIDQSLPIIE